MESTNHNANGKVDFFLPANARKMHGCEFKSQQVLRFFYRSDNFANNAVNLSFIIHHNKGLTFMLVYPEKLTFPLV